VSHTSINLTLKVWRQKNASQKGGFEVYLAKDVDTNASFLEMLDVVNEGLEKTGKEPIAFDHDCREGICGCCGLVINGRAHGPVEDTTLCQLHMRQFKDKDVLVIEPFRSKPFKVIKDLVIDRSAFDRIISAGGYASVNTGNAGEANQTLIPRDNAELAMDAAACIGCGSCVASCPNASAMLYVSAKVSQFSLLPQGAPERNQRVLRMVTQMDKEGFGSCSNEYECMRACPKGIDISNIARMNREYLKSSIVS
jgi:succinate dehydrogenase / fumarate reductase, iron-sulfur subunit